MSRCNSGRANTAVNRWNLRVIMPSKPRDRAKPTFYLDHSTLCDTFRAHVRGGGTPAAPEYRPLFRWVERVAAEANLCLSLFHVDELRRWGDVESAHAMARWYDGLPIVWVRSTDSVQRVEDEYWVKVAAGIEPAEKVSPFAPSLLGSYDHLSGDAVSEFLRMPEPVVALLEATREADHDKPLDALMKLAERFRIDRAQADERGWSDERKEEETAYLLRVDLRTRAMHADRRLVAAGDPEYARKTCTGGEVQDRLVELYENDPAALPSFRAVRRFTEGFVASALRRTPGSENERRALRGSFHDWVHLSIGAAYCDVFTSDGIVHGWLGDLRENLGLRPQMAVAAHPEGRAGFVRDLMATWP